MLGFGFFGQRM